MTGLSLKVRQGSVPVAQRLGIYTLADTAKLNDMDPQAYLRHVLERIADHTITRVDELPPREGKSAREQAGADAGGVRNARPARRAQLFRCEPVNA